MIMMLRPIAESLAGARPRSRSHSYTGDIKGWSVEVLKGTNGFSRTDCRFM